MVVLKMDHVFLKVILIEESLHAHAFTIAKYLVKLL